MRIDREKPVTKVILVPESPVGGGRKDLFWTERRLTLLPSDTRPWQVTQSLLWALDGNNLTIWPLVKLQLDSYPLPPVLLFFPLGSSAVSLVSL